jgi:hypothetical protein
MFGTFSVLTYVPSLRGSECLLLDIQGMLKYNDTGDDHPSMVALFGIRKGEHLDRCLYIFVLTSHHQQIKLENGKKNPSKIRKVRGNGMETCFYLRTPLSY